MRSATSRARRGRSATRRSALGALVATLLAATVLGGCVTGSPPATPPVTPGTSGSPRDVNIIARDYAYVPPTVDLVPGETVRLHLVNGGLEIHEAILGDLASQLAWETAEGATVGHPPGPTPLVPDPPGFEGLRVVVGSGQRIDVVWTVPLDAPAAADGWFVGCHIPGHWQKGMVVPVRFVGPDGRPLPTGSPSPSGSPSPAGG